MSFARPAPADVSYLHARESGYGMARARASSVALPGLAPPQRDITGELVEQQGAAGAGAGESGDALRVFLRIRPQLESDFADLPPHERKPVLERSSNVHLLMHAPKDSATYKNGMNGNGKLTHRYTFSHIYGPETGQQQLFRQTTLEHVRELLDGRSCLLFTYGATNSGKTHTVQGTPSEPGLLPRALDVLFNSVSDRLYARLDVQPRGFSDVCLVSPREEEAARRVQRHALLLGAETDLPPPASGDELPSDSEASCLSLYRSQDSLAMSVESLAEVPPCPEVAGRCRESDSVSIHQPRTRFSVWVSYLEIYNDYVYDLLERPSSGQRRRTALHLGLDRKGNTFVKGLRQVPVRSADEAIQVVRAGRQNLHFASNRLNHNSSRSHCVFTVRLIRLLDTDNPSVARISQFSVCDLAGSERVEKTLAAGVRMKEAGNINSSLMVLGRCMKALRQSQKTAGGGAAPGGGMVPYRDSKLTRLFQSYFSGGGGRVTMIVNVGPSPVVFDETIQVLKFSALAKQVSVQQPEKRRAPSRFSMMARRSVQVAAAAVAGAVGRPRPLLDSTAGSLDSAAADEQHQNLLALVESLRTQLVESRRENVALETRIRQELCAEFEQHVVQIEQQWQERMQETERYMESRAELQLTAVAAGIKAELSRKRRRTADSDDDDEDDNNQLADELKEAREQLAAAEQRCQLLEQQLEAEAADQQQAAQRAQQRQQELGRLAVELAEQRETAEQMRRERDEAEERHRRLAVELSAGAEPSPAAAAELGRQVAQLQEELHFREMDLREAREYLKEGGDELLQLEADVERLQRQVTELRQQLAQRDEELRDQQALQADLEHLLDARSQRVAELEARLERRAPAAAAAPSEDSGEQQNPADVSFGSRLRALRTRTGAVLSQVTRPAGERTPAHDQTTATRASVHTTEQEAQTDNMQSHAAESQTEEARQNTADHESQTDEQVACQTEEQESQTEAEESRQTADGESQTAADCAADGTDDQKQEQQQQQQQERELSEARAELAEFQQTAARLEGELRSVSSQLEEQTAECARLRQAATDSESQQQQARALAEERLRQATDAQHELDELQRQYKQALHARSEAEADAGVCEREMKALRADLERERSQRHGGADESALERLRARDAELTLLRDSHAQVREALRVIQAELEAKSEELRQNNAADLRAQLERAEAEAGHMRDELERRSNELLKLNIHLERLKQQLTERDEDLLKAREERTRSMLMSEQNIRRKNEELNRERHESSHLRDMMARLTPRTSSTLQAELEAVRAACRRKDDRIEQLESRLKSSQAELSAACTPTPRLAGGRQRSVQIVVDGDESDVTPMVLRGSRSSRSSRSSRRTTGRAPPPPTETDHSEGEESERERTTTTGRRRTGRRATNRSAVRFTDENAAGSEDMSEAGSTVSGGGGRPREPLAALTEQQPGAAATTPADKPPPPRTVKSTGTKRKLFKRTSDIMECSPVQVTEKRVSPRTVVTRSLRSRKK